MLHPIPVEVSEKVPQVGPHLFFIKKDQVIGVDPKDRNAVPGANSDYYQVCAEPSRRIVACLQMGKETPDVPSETVCDSGRQLPDETIEDRRERFAREGREAMADYRAAEAALRDRSKELRAMRQAQEANSSPSNGGARTRQKSTPPKRRQQSR